MARQNRILLAPLTLLDELMVQFRDLHFGTTLLAFVGHRAGTPLQLVGAFKSGVHCQWAVTISLPNANTSFECNFNLVCVLFPRPFSFALLGPEHFLFSPINFGCVVEMLSRNEFLDHCSA